MNLVSRAVRGAAVILFVLGAGVVSSGQAPEPTKTSERSEETNFVLVGDMLVTQEQFALMFDSRSRRQGAVIYGPTYPWIQPWPLGIVPISFGSEVSADRRAMVWAACDLWKRAGLVMCIPHTVQTLYVHVTASGTGCGAYVGPASPSRFNFGADWCWQLPLVAHDLGHNLGLIHEHQRPDRDLYVEVDITNVEPDFVHAYTVRTGAVPHTPYDFESLMHYPDRSYAIDPRRPIIVPRAGYVEAARNMGRLSDPSAGDLDAVRSVYGMKLGPYGAGRPTEAVMSRFSRTDFLGAMDQLHAFYSSSNGLARNNGLAINCRPDFVGIAEWIFGVYLGARSAGFDRDSAFDIVVAAITQTEEWKAKHPGARSLTPTPFTPYVSFDRNEFLSTLERLDRFYSSAEGLQRPDGLSIDGAPDFQGIATWIFDVYLSQRLTGASPNAAWIAVENAIRQTDEWKSKH